MLDKLKTTAPAEEKLKVPREKVLIKLSSKEMNTDLAEGKLKAPEGIFLILFLVKARKTLDVALGKLKAPASIVAIFDQDASM